MEEKTPEICLAHEETMPPGQSKTVFATRDHTRVDGLEAEGVGDAISRAPDLLTMRLG